VLPSPCFIPLKLIESKDFSPLAIAAIANDDSETVVLVDIERHECPIGDW
jgi:hypothetical protein